MTITVPSRGGIGQGTAPAPTGSPVLAQRVTVVHERCAGCQECVVRCPTGALAMDVMTWTVVANDSACVGCRQCVRVCPFSAIAVEGPMAVAARTPLPAPQHLPLLGDSSETRRGFATLEEALAEASRCLRCPDPTCVRGCPAHNDIPGFITALSEGDLEGAHEVLRRTTFLPDICSRVCDQAVQCEGACSWSLAGGVPVAIGALERFVAENAAVPDLVRTSDEGDGLSVVVVGSGPAGIAAAWELRSAGADVTVLERDSQPGGLLGWGIPDFTLPAEVARRPWDQLQAAGVDLHLDTALEPEGIDDLLAEHDAVVLAIGAGSPLRLPVAGANLGSVIDATQFLTEAEKALRDRSPLPFLGPFLAEAGDGHEGPTVLVVGGGNTAMDVARSARRLGARAVCVEWMDKRFAPVRPDELAEAESEGVEVLFSTTLTRLEGDGSTVRRAFLRATRQAKASKRPRPVRGSQYSLPVDLVVMAMGYRNYADFATALPPRQVRRVAEGLPDRRWQASGIFAGGAPSFARCQPVGKLALGREVARTTAALPARDRVWVAGDALVGPSTVVEAMAQGRRAAQALLARRPRRPGMEDRSLAPRSVLVAVESRGGRTRAKAEEIAAELRRRGAGVVVARLSEIGRAQIAWADLLVVGTWVEGAVVAAVHPARRAREWIATLPALGGTPVAAFCTYGIDAKGAVRELSGSLAGKGGTVVAAAAFGPRGRDSVLSFADSLVPARQG